MYINVEDDMGQVFLRIAAAECYMGMVELLVGYGARIDSGGCSTLAERIWLKRLLDCCE